MNEYQARGVSSCAYLEADLGGDIGSGFYAGFSGKIEQGGVFISTYDTKPINTKAIVSILFPNQAKAAVEGVVEWVREYNPLVPEMMPGMGVRLQLINSTDKAKIDSYLSEHPPLFYEGDSEAANEKSPALPRGEENLAQEDCLPACSDEQLFYSGLARDIDLYLQKHGSSLREIADMSLKPLRQKSRPPAETGPSAEPFDTCVRIVGGEKTERQFQGGFSEGDSSYRLFVATFKPRPIGAKVEARVLLPDGWQFRARGVVRWVRKYNPALATAVAPPGMGICFDDVPESAWQIATSSLPYGEGYLVGEEVAGA